MSKNIAIFIDGTWNSGDEKPATNVFKLFDAIQGQAVQVDKDCDVKTVSDGTTQIACYIPGVGTGGLLDAIAGGMSGFGTAIRIQQAYLFLATNYVVGDSVYLFGFSRGAFAARSLASFIGVVGPQLSNRKADIAEAYVRFLGSTSEAEYLKNVKDLNIERIESIPVHFIGVWDTVRALRLEALGIEWQGHPNFPYLPAHINHARHALALHETRPEFEPTVWEDRTKDNTIPGQILKQVWFSGAHADVGGGYPESESELSNVPLHWMANEAAVRKLAINLEKLQPIINATEVQPHFESSIRERKPREMLKKLEAKLCGEDNSHSFHETAIEHMNKDQPKKFRFGNGLMQAFSSTNAGKYDHDLKCIKSKFSYLKLLNHLPEKGIGIKISKLKI